MPLTKSLQVYVSKKNRPGLLKEGGTVGMTFKMSASQFWAFMKYFPFSISHLVPFDSEHWGLILALSEIIDLVMAPNLPTFQPPNLLNRHWLTSSGCINLF